MALTADIYRALEDVVGSDNISEEMVILDSYAFQWPAELIPTGHGDRFYIRPEAVVLPGSTEEVQGIVRACNRYKIKFKAFSTGWGIYGTPASEGVIQLDLRRMNRILEINERNMYAVLEPYVIGARLQAELMKRGLNCHMVTAGASCAAFPLAAVGPGNGWSSVSTGRHPRNVLGVEWVLPTGEILRLGSLGSGAGWFSGDGPGPSLRGLLRGYLSAGGGVGVFTKAATKIYHWPGPTDSPLEGVSPSYTVKPLEGKKAYCLFFPSVQGLAEAGIKIAENELAYVLTKISPQRLAWSLATNNEEGAELYSKILEQLGKNLGFLLVTLNANSIKELDYRDKVLKRIVAETGGKSLPLIEDPVIQGELLWHRIRASDTSRGEFRPAGGNTASHGVGETVDFALSFIKPRAEVERPYAEKGLIMYVADDSSWGEISEHGHMAHLGNIYVFDSCDPGARKAVTELSEKANRIPLEKFKLPITGMGSEAHDMLGPLQGNYHLLQRKIKEMIDPNVASDPGLYIELQSKHAIINRIKYIRGM